MRTTENEKLMELSIEELRHRWIMLRVKYGINTLIVSEHFSRHPSRIYAVCNLCMYFDNDNWVCCCDDRNILSKECSVLSLFLKYQITKIEVNPLVEERLEFGSDGYVIIRVK